MTDDRLFLSFLSSNGVKINTYLAKRLGLVKSVIVSELLTRGNHFVDDGDFFENIGLSWGDADNALFSLASNNIVDKDYKTKYNDGVYDIKLNYDALIESLGER